MIVEAQYDTTKLQHKSLDLVDALIGSGANEGQIQMAIKTETGQMMGRIGDAVGPTTEAKGMKPIDRDLKSQLTILPKYSVFTEDAQKQSSKYADFTWLTAGPNYLTGINNEDNLTNIGGEEAYRIFRAGQNSTPRGKSMERLGQRGRQIIQRVNRVRVNQATYRDVRRRLAEKAGQLRAACYAVAVQYVPAKRVPAWLRRKFTAVQERGKSHVTESFARDHGSIQVTIRGPGVESNEKLRVKFQRGINKSVYLLDAKVKKILRGFKYNWETGQVFRAEKDSDFGEN